MSKPKTISNNKLEKLESKLAQQEQVLREKERELEIEAALERVRARTMAMQHSDELREITNVLFLQVQALGIPAWSAGYCEFAEDKKSCTCNMSSEGVLQPPFQLPFTEHRTMRPWLKSIERGDEFYTQELDGKDIKDHYTYLLALPGVTEMIDEIADAGFSLPTYQINHLSFFSHGFLLFITYEEVPDAHDIFRRFTKVFEQTYTRFLDLQKAETQTREAQIEAALERTRAQSMLMQHSSELNNISKVFHEQLHFLGIDSEFSHVWLPDEPNSTHLFWATWSETGKGKKDTVSKAITYDLDKSEPYTAACFTAWESEDPVHIEFIPPEEVSTFFSTWKELFRSAKKLKARHFKNGIYYAEAYMKYGCFGINIRRSLDEEELHILRRFAVEFERAYTRFLDLQKAEQQAREAQIEAALETVRSRSLAMHQSIELNDVVAVLFEKLKELQIPATAVGIAISIEGSKDLNGFVCGENKDGLVITNYRLPYFNNKIAKDICNAIDKQLDYFVGHYSKAVKNSFYKYLLQHTEEFKHLPEDIKQMIFGSPTYSISMVAVKNAVFNINDFEGKILAENEVEIIKRFANVFEQAYTRFLDLKKAEAQAREAKIEAALERVRARMMAMHRSDELRQVVSTVFTQLSELGFDAAGCNLIVYNETRAAEHWMAGFSDDLLPESFTIPYNEHPYFLDLFDAWKSNVLFQEFVFEGKPKVEYGKWALETGVFKHIPNEFKKEIKSPDRIVLADAFNKYGMIEIMGVVPLKQDEIEVVSRFSKVFEQTYTRFLDLQKAEAQAREAEIELAIERVRNKAIAMRESHEVSELMVTLFQELQGLDMILTRCFLWVFNPEDRSATAWMTNSEHPDLADSYHIPYHNHPAYKSLLKAWNTQDPNWEYLLKGKTKNSWDEILVYGYLKALPAKVKRAMKDLDQVQLTGSFNKFGGIQTASVESLSAENREILHRFSQVFEQTYTRFLDLQKAEAQAREANIEASLERIRASSLAMHKSSELLEVIQVISGQLEELGVRFNHVSFGKNNQLEDYKFWTAIRGQDKPVLMDVPRINHPMTERLKKVRKDKLTFFTDTLTPKQNDRWNEHLFKHHDMPWITPEQKQKLKNMPFARSLVILPNIFLVVSNSKGLPFSYEENQIIKRVASVFQQAYTRFLDLQTAEAQSREAQIEAALERVRARTMAMHNSSDVLGVVDLLYLEMSQLDVELTRIVLLTIDPDTMGMLWWMANPEMDIKAKGYLVPHNKLPFTLAMIEGWNKKVSTWHYQLKGKNKQRYDQFIFSESELTQLPKQVQKAMSSLKQVHISGYCDNFGILTTSSIAPLSRSNQDLLIRFGQVFEQTYTRFLDLKKAEAQAREALIEASLERVRARSIGMQKSEELQEVILLIYDQMRQLGIMTDSVQVEIYKEGSNDINVWVANEFETYGSEIAIKDLGFQIVKRYVDARKKGKEEHYFSIDKKMKDRYYARAFKETDFKYLPEGKKDVIKKGDYLTVYGVFMRKTGLQFVVFDRAEFEPEEKKILKRFAEVFDQFYTRFLDLKMAEAQAREAQIETALERVRAQSMAMQKSAELADLSLELVKQVQALGIATWFCAFNIYDEDKKGSMEWGSNGEGTFPKYRTPREGIFLRYYEAGQRGETLLINEIGEDECPAHYEYLCSLPGVGEQLLKMRDSGIPFPDSQIDHVAYHKYGYLLFISYEPVPEAQDIFSRFASVFEQTYTRFLDLQRAEAQAREAQIEAALERVRARTMSMQESGELAETATVLFQQLHELGVVHERINIGIVDEPNKIMDFWVTTQGGSKVDMQFTAHVDKLSAIKDLFAAWKAKKKRLVMDLKGAKLKKWLEFTTKELGIPFDKKLVTDRRVQNAAFFAQGMLVVSNPDPLSEEDMTTLVRFADVFNLTYARFSDLKVAEAQTHKANIEVALERVRARALAMQTPEELVEVAEVMWKEMGLLGVEELETSSIYINGEGDQAEVWYAIKDIRSKRKKLVSDHFHMEYKKTAVGRKMDKFYRSKDEEVSIVMKGADRKEWIKYCAEQSKNLRGYYGDEIPERTYHLCKFSNGAIGAATPGPISEASWNLFRRGCTVFSLAYSRFKDLTQARMDLQLLKEQKALAESALSDLRATQSQLIQSEKMASLGELTAGIAHEIQNPLNFVNNFAEVSGDLVDELKGERLKVKGDRDEELEDEILDDVIQNLEKIAHHGKRASGIVKGMLEHSRTGDGTKEPTDLNVLVDEYLRLAYHGLRAKDKSFNADFKLELDNALPKIKIIPQDIGRVLLNLINNAFHAVNEKAKDESKDYKPLVTVSTSHIPPARKAGRLSEGVKGEEKVLIRVTDNGPGIPDSIRDKIFQPFFTTKATGEGTGLGLSLSYDIITKGHRGTIEMESSEEKGSEFSIKLPIN